MGVAKKVYADIWEHLEHSRWDRLSDCFTQDVQIIFQDAHFTGAKPLLTYLQAVMQALPDLTHEIVEIMEREDGAALAGVVVARGTHVSAVDMFGEKLDLRGRQSEFKAVDLLWLREGKVSKWWAMYDPLERARSLGIVLKASLARS